ncbi:hypothetical protein D3C87_196070 [compost metagenome]
MRYASIYIVLLFAAFSCKKSNHPCEGKYSSQHMLISSSLNSYQFKEGSYWVYQNDGSAQLDSQRVVSTIRSKIGSGGSSSCSSVSAETYQMSIRCSFNNQFFNYHMLGGYLSKETFVPGKQKAVIFSNTNSFAPDNGVQLLEIIPSMDLNGNTVTNVKKVRADLPANDIILYFADSVGIVKWEKLSGGTISETWSIQSWEVFL